MERIFDHIRDAIFVIEDKRISFLNKSASNALNTPKEHLIGKDIFTLSSNVPFTRLLWRILKEWEDTDNEVSEPFSIKIDKYECTLLPLRDTEKERIAIIISNLIDKSQRDIMSTASHELKTPLTSIKGFAETLILNGLKNKEMAMKYLKIIEKEATRMTNLINELLDILRLEADDFQLHYKTVNLKEIAQYVIDLVKPLAIEGNVSLVLEAGEAIDMFGDPELLTQLFSNLLDNAVKYTSQKVGEKKVKVEIFKRENEIVIRVSDTGIGIPKDAIPHIFDKFYRSERFKVPGTGGSGLGLSIVRSIVEKHKGYIKVDSEEGKGTIFTVYFPIQTDNIMIVKDEYLEKIEKIKDAIDRAHSILVIGHIRPDGDCISSVLGLSYALEKLGKDAIPCLEDDVPRVFRGIPAWESIVKPQELRNRRFDLVFIVDSSDIERIGKANELLEEGVSVVVLDHHKTNKSFGDINWVDSSYASTSQIIYEFLKAIKFNISPKHAQILLTGIVTDTGFFKYSNVTRKALEDTAELVELGGNINDIANMVLENMTLEQLNLYSKFLQTIHIESNGRLGWGYVSGEMFRETDTKEGDAAFFVQTIRSINTVEVAILFIEEDEGIHVEFRSKKFIDVSEIALHFGGGGHERAAGCTLKDTSLEEARKRVLQYVIEELDKQNAR